MAMPRKTYTKDDGLLYKVCVMCGCEKTVDNFSQSTQHKKYKTYDSKCKPCKGKYSRQWAIDREKRARRQEFLLEEQLKAVREQLILWQPVYELAKANPLSNGFQSPQEFIIATLKTTYDNGRQKTG